MRRSVTQDEYHHVTGQVLPAGQTDVGRDSQQPVSPTT